MSTKRAIACADADSMVRSTGKPSEIVTGKKAPENPQK
jgi:hypothetical protein